MSDSQLSPLMKYEDDVSYVHATYNSTVTNISARTQALCQMTHVTKYLYTRTFRRFADAIDIEFTKHNLPLSDQVKNDIVRNCLKFLEKIKSLILPKRSNLRLCFVCVSHHILKAELQSELLDIDFITRALYGDQPIKKRVLTIYMSLFKRKFLQPFQGEFKVKLLDVVTLILKKFHNSSENYFEYEKLEEKYFCLFGKILDFSQQLKCTLQTMKLKNIATAIAFFLLQSICTIDINVHTFIDIIQSDPDTKDDKLNHVSHVHTKLLKTICYNSVTNIYYKIANYFQTFFLDNIMKDKANHYKLINFNKKIRQEIYSINILIKADQDPRVLIIRILKICLAVKKLLDSDVLK